MTAFGRGRWIAVSLLIVPQMASACAVCMGGQEEESRFAFIATTVFLSVLPLALIGGLAWFVRREYRNRDAAQELARISGSNPVAELETRPRPIL